MQTAVQRWSVLAGIGLATLFLQGAEPTEAVPTSALEREAHGMSMILERDIMAKDPGSLERCFDFEACLDVALDGLHPSSRVEAAYRSRARESFNAAFGRSLLEATSVHFLRMRRVDHQPRFVFRVAPKRGGVNYFELLFVRTRREGVRAVDLYDFSIGQKLSYTLRHAFLPVAHATDPGWSDRLGRADAEFLEHEADLQTMISLNAQSRYREALALYSKLPNSLQREKLFLLPQLQAAVRADTRALNDAVELWRLAYPGEASVDLVLANLFFAKRSIEPAFAALDRFDKTFAVDAYLDVLRAQQYKNQDRLDDARASARKAITRNPRIREGWELLVTVDLTRRHYAEVAQVLTEWESKTSLDVHRLAMADKYYDFKRSTAGKGWFAERAGRHPAATEPASAPKRLVASTPAAAPAPAAAPQAAQK